MKSFIQVLVIFCISQAVCCRYYIELVDNDKYAQESRSEFLEFFKNSGLFKVIKNCNTTEFMTILSKAERKEISLQIEKYNNADYFSKSIDLITEIKTFFTQCIDPNYIDLVDKLYEVISKLLKIRSDMNDDDVKVLQEINAKDQSNCANESRFQIFSCIFSEPEVVQITKNFNNAVNFTIELFDGNDKQCGVVNRIEKCVLQSTKKCKSNTLSKYIEYFFNIMMKSFECKVDETINIAESTTEPLKDRDFYLETLKNATRNCNFVEIGENLTSVLQKLSENETPKTEISPLTTENEMYVLFINELCGKRKVLKSATSEIISTLTQCVDPKYVNHIQKLGDFNMRSFDVSCHSKDQLLSMISIMNKIKEEKTSLKKCFLKNALQLTGCVFSQVGVRELIADRSLISNFVLELLDGNDKQCGTLNEIQMCLVETLQNCDDKEFLNVFKISFDITLESLQCKKVDNSMTRILFK